MVEENKPPNVTEDERLVLIQSQLNQIKQQIAEMKDLDKGLDKIDDDRFELIQRRLTDKVTEQVRPALFRYYAVIGSIVIAVLGFVGWDYKAEIKTAVMNDISQEIKEKRNEIEESVIKTDVLAKKATKTIDEVDSKLPKLEKTIEVINGNIKKISDLNTDVGNAQENVGSFQQNIKDLGILSTKIKVVENQLEQLQIELTNARIIKKQPNVTKAIEEKVNEEEKKTTVYFQFAGGTREKAKSLSNNLQNKGYIVPGEQRIREAAKKSEVRYFYAGDQEKAQKLVDYLNNGNFGIPYNKPVTSVNFIAYKKTKPPQGTIELWLQIN